MLKETDEEASLNKFVGIYLHASTTSSEFAADRSRSGMKLQQSTVKAPINPVKPGDPITSTTSHGLNVCLLSMAIGFGCAPWRGICSAVSSSLQSSVCGSPEWPPLRFDESSKVPLFPVSN
jgi:hypothetical protein